MKIINKVVIKSEVLVNLVHCIILVMLPVLMLFDVYLSQKELCPKVEDSRLPMVLNRQ